jgi:hypothetical protein
VESLKSALKKKRYFAEFIDAAIDIPDEHRYGLLKHITTEIDKEGWSSMAKRDTHHRNLITLILFYFSGSERKKEPCVDDLIALIDDYRSSRLYKRIESKIDGTAVKKKKELEMEWESLAKT